MALYKRGNTWWIQYTAPNGERVQRSANTKNKQHAQELHDKLKAESWRIKEFAQKQSHTWQEAADRWLIEQSHKRSIEDDKKLLRWLHHT